MDGNELTLESFLRLKNLVLPKSTDPCEKPCVLLRLGRLLILKPMEPRYLIVLMEAISEIETTCDSLPDEDLHTVSMLHTVVLLRQSRAMFE